MDRDSAEYQKFLQEVDEFLAEHPPKPLGCGLQFYEGTVDLGVNLHPPGSHRY